MRIDALVREFYDNLSAEQQAALQEVADERKADLDRKVYAGTKKTPIHRFAIGGGEIEYAACGEVRGTVLNRYSMDEHEGYFRIATTAGALWGVGENLASNNVYVLDLELQVVGALEGLAPGERIYSARFMGDRCYLVTFKKVDPLFVIDLKEPSAPRVLGELKIPGYSDYLHPYDETHLIGIGKETIEAEEGDFAWYQGVKVSLFDVSVPEKPKELWKYVIGDRGTYSPALRDPKALLFDRNKNLLVLPIKLAEIDQTEYPEGVPPYAHGEYVWEGVYVFHVSMSQGLILRGRVAHSETLEPEHAIKRSFYIGEVLYTVSSAMLKMNSLADLQELNLVELGV
jgi:uncharacterized secreted protein with C-terminal beta-propeller domain